MDIGILSFEASTWSMQVLSVIMLAILGEQGGKLQLWRFLSHEYFSDHNGFPSNIESMETT